MSTKIEAAASIRKLANIFKDMGVAADVLESIGSAEQAAAEAEARVKEAQAAAVAEIDRINKERADAAAAVDSMRAEVESIERQIADQRSACAAQCQSLLDEAAAEANAMATEGRLAAQKAMDDILQAVESATKERDAAAAEAERCRAEIAAKQSVLDGLQAKIDAARKMMGDFVLAA